MTNEHKLQLLKSWQEVSKQYMETIPAYIDVTHCAGEVPYMPHIMAGDNVIDEYTKLVAELTGIPFDELICWVYDLHCGEVASYDVRLDGEWRSARTIGELFSIWNDINKEVADK